MSIEKQKLYREIETLPEELTIQVINFVEYLKFSQIDENTIDSISIKSKEDLKDKLKKGLEDIENNQVYSVEEMIEKIDSM